MIEDLEDPDTYCNPIEMLDEAEEGLKQWVEEDNHE
tara:strand:- start:263 stop:370 length:108 start_codon:yes stop_codon:yes gene_type:complete